MFRKYNIGIIGSGNIAGVMADTIKRMKNVRLYAVASRSKVKADVFAEKYGCKKAYGSYEELASDSKVDLVYIATPHSEHYENAKLCLLNGNPSCAKKLLRRMRLRQRSSSGFRRREECFLQRPYGQGICRCSPRFGRFLAVGSSESQRH